MCSDRCAVAAAREAFKPNRIPRPCECVTAGHDDGKIARAAPSEFPTQAREADGRVATVAAAGTGREATDNNGEAAFPSHGHPFCPTRVTPNTRQHVSRPSKSHEHHGGFAQCLPLQARGDAGRRQQLPWLHRLVHRCAAAPSPLYCPPFPRPAAPIALTAFPPALAQVFRVPARPLSASPSRPSCAAAACRATDWMATTCARD